MKLNWYIVIGGIAGIILMAISGSAIVSNLNDVQKSDERAKQACVDLKKSIDGVKLAMDELQAQGGLTQADVNRYHGMLADYHNSSCR